MRKKTSLILTIVLAMLLSFSSQALAVGDIYLNYGPYTRKGQNPNWGAVISQEQLYEQLSVLAFHGVSMVKTFSCTHGLENVGPIAHSLGISVVAGCWLSSDLATNETELAALIACCQLGHVDVAIIGSETLYRGDLTSAQLIGYIDRFRAALPRFPVTVADTASALSANPDVVAASDAIMANFYPYWKDVPIMDAPANLRSNYYALKNQYPNKLVVIGETGWPTTGKYIAGTDIPEEAFYFCAVMSWARMEGIIIFMFEAFNEPWKAAYEALIGDKWGIWDENYTLKPYMQFTLNGLILPAKYWKSEPILPPEGDPEIVFTYVPPKGSTEDLRGKTYNISPNTHNVVVYIKVDGKWWVKPTFDQPTTPIIYDGTFTCNITTGGDDINATDIAAFVIPKSYPPPTLGGSVSLPEELYENSIASIEVAR